MENHVTAIPTWAFGLLTTGALAIMGVLARAFWRFADRLMERDDRHDKELRLHGEALREHEIRIEYLERR